MGGPDSRHLSQAKQKNMSSLVLDEKNDTALCHVIFCLEVSIIRALRQDDLIFPDFLRFLRECVFQKYKRRKYLPDKVEKHRC